jgi:hypothetical protein
MGSRIAIPAVKLQAPFAKPAHIKPLIVGWIAWSMYVTETSFWAQISVSRPIVASSTI